MTINFQSYQENVMFSLSKIILLLKQKPVPDRTLNNYFLLIITLGEIYPHVIMPIKAFTLQNNSSCGDEGRFGCIRVLQYEGWASRWEIQRRVVIVGQVQRMSASSIPSCSREVSLLFFSGLQLAG